MAEFIECTSLSVNYNIMGIATVSFVIVHDEPGLKVYNSIEAGGQVFTGWVINASLNIIPNTENWWESHVTLLATTDGTWEDSE